MNFIKSFLKILGSIIFLAIFLFVSGELFAPKQTDRLVFQLSKYFVKTEETAKEKIFRIGLSEKLTMLDPLSNEVSNRERLLQIYEGLVRTDAFLQIEPALAIAFGAQDDFTWEFRLRKNVLFHDGSPLTVDDVISSIEQAWKNPRSGVSGFLAAISGIKKIDEDRFLIITKIKDPLLLQKLALVLIFPKRAEGTQGTLPIGTGSYRFISNENDEVILEAFPQYWGKKPHLTKIALVTLKNRDERKEAYEKATVDLLTNVPPEIVISNEKEKPGLKFVTAQTLESNFLLFGFQGLFQEKSLRKAVLLSFDRNEVAKLAFGFAKPLSQFVPRGIFGFHPGIEIPRQNLDEAKRLASLALGVKEKVIHLDLPIGFQAVGQFFLERLKRIGLKPEVRLHPPEELEKLIIEGKSDLFFFGWRSTLGDASGLLGSVMHSRGREYGSFNGMSYKNPEVDLFIEEADQIFKPLERLEKLRNVMKILVEEDIVGVPLFTPEALYGVRQGIKFSPRMDGFVLASEIMASRPGGLD